MGSVRRRDSVEQRIRIINALLDLVSEHGIANVSCRSVAKVAGVNLASINYYFDSMESLIVESFSYFVEEEVPSYLDAMHVGQSVGEITRRISMLATGECLDKRSSRDLSIVREMYACASRTPELHAVVNFWRQKSITLMMDLYGVKHALLVCAFIEWISACPFKGCDVLSMAEFEELIRFLVELTVPMQRITRTAVRKSDLVPQ